ncbi:MAG: hypothetical protein ED557_02595 [Balneola sp.]|nr:MAG: hypothetical protein ED557_02595 [Balneola sp.]
MKTYQIISRTLLTSFFILGTIIYANAQPPEGQRGMPQIDFKKIAESQVAWFSENFELSEDQTKKITDIHIESGEQRQELIESGLTPRDEDFREKMGAINVALEASLKEILTAEQLKIFEEKKEEYVQISRPQSPRRGRN